MDSKDIEEIIEEWKDKKGNVIMILHAIQNKYGYVPRDVSFVLQEKLDIPLARIYEVITFYNYFRLEKPGKHKIAVCMGTACYLKGASELVEELKRVLAVEEGETSQDGLFTLETVRCIGCCGLAPVIMVDDKVYGNLTRDDITGVLSKFVNKATA